MKKILITILCSVLCVILVLFAQIICSPYAMNRYFKTWMPEINVDIVHLPNSFGDLEMDSRRISLSDTLKASVNEVFCVRNDRIYFVCEYQNKWCIASLSVLNRNDLKYHGEIDVMNETTQRNVIYKSFSRLSNRQDFFGGFYLGNKIFLKGPLETISYDIDADILQNEEMPAAKYTWEIVDHKSVFITDIETQETKQITLEGLAQKNSYAQKALDRCNKKIWSGDHPDFFARVVLIGEDLYFVGQLLSFYGETFAVVFRYDFTTDQAYYVSNYHTGGSTDPYYFVFRS